MRPVVIGLCTVLIGGISFAAQQKETKEKSKDATTAAEYKIPPEEVARKNPVTSSPADLAQAKHFYSSQCAMCHGEGGDGKGELVEAMKLKMRDWRDPAALEKMTDGELFYILTNGKGQMIGQGDRITAHSRWNLVNYIRTFAKKAAPPPAAGAKP